MRGCFEKPRRVTDWIKAHHGGERPWSDNDFSIRQRGARMRSAPVRRRWPISRLCQLLPEGWESTPLRVYLFPGMTGIRSRRQPRAVLG